MESITHIYKTPEDLANAFAGKLITWIIETPGDIFHLALSGGKTPSMLYSLLAGKYIDEVPWQKIHFWWGDERMVSPGDPESNFGVVNKLLFSGIELSPGQIHRIKGEDDPTIESKRYGSEIKKVIPEVDGWPAFDLVMLGLGDDGHTASIFPDQMHLMKSDEIAAIALHPLTGQQRITLTGKVLNNARKVAFLVTGESKAEIFNEVIHDSKDALTYPASHIQPAGELHWFVDEACMHGKIDNSENKK
jgi:6-phosphogluconolactonase